MAKAKHFWQQDYRTHIGATIFLVITFLALVIGSSGTPIGMLVDCRGAECPKEIGEGGCFTLWGGKKRCISAYYDLRFDGDNCADRRHRIDAARAFSVIALFTMLINFGVGCLQLSGSNIKMYVLGLSVFAIGATTVPWAAVVSLYYNHYCGEYLWTKRHFKLGPGCICLITSFALQCVGFLLFLFLEPDFVDTSRHSEEITPADAEKSASDEDSQKSSDKKSSNADN